MPHVLTMTFSYPDLLQASLPGTEKKIPLTDSNRCIRCMMMSAGIQ